MPRFLARRLTQGLFALLATVTIVFLLTQMTGNPAAAYLPQGATQAQLEETTRRLGLDRPLPEQYASFIWRAAHGDFGESLSSGRSATERLLEGLPATLELGLAAAGFAVGIGVPLGVQAAVRQGTRLDRLAQFFAVIGQSVPVFWSGVVAILVFSVWLEWVPTGGRGSLHHLIMPAVILGWFSAAGIMRLTRSAMLEVLESDYVLLARSKGISEFRVVYIHGLRNALLPVVTFGVILAVQLLSGAIVAEVVFSWPGIGTRVYNAILSRDYPTVQAGVVLLSSLFILGNILVDILHVWMDPRVRGSSATAGAVG